MPKLNQVNAVVTAKKPEVESAVKGIHKIVQKEALFLGRQRTYRPFDEVNGQKQPPEVQKVQHKVGDLVRQVARTWNEMWSLILTQDTGNKTAVADIVVDGKAVMKDVPVTTLLYLDKQVNDLATFVESLPVPDLAEEWTYDGNIGLLRSRATESLRTSKEPTVIVKYEATEHHPAQTELFNKDVPVGTWTQTFYSGAIPADEKEKLLTNVRKLQVAIKEAREQANQRDVERQNTGDILKFVFGEGVLN